MNNIYIVFLIIGLITMLFRLLPIFIKIPDDNKRLNKFFELLPISILTCLALPDVLFSIGNSKIDVLISILSIAFVGILTYKKKNLAYIAFGVCILIILFKEVLFWSYS